MTIDRQRLVDYLIERGLADSQGALDIEFEEGRSNAIYRVRGRPGGGLFVKVAPSADPRWTAPLAREAELYRLIGTRDELGLLRDLTPRLTAYDGCHGILILELFPDARNVTDEHRERGFFPAEIGGLLGRRLACIHAGFEMRRGDAFPQGLLPREWPWGLSFHRTGVEARHQWRPTERAFVDAVCRDQVLVQALESLAGDWRIETLIHGDLKWDNCLLLDGVPTHDRLRIVDWECADLGDPVWDVATVLQGYLAFWSLSLQADAARPDSPEQTPWERLRSMHASVREFMRVYAAGRNMPPAETAAFVSRSVRFAGARFLSAVFEYPQMSPATLHNVLQLSHDLLLNSHQAASELLGLETA